MKINEPVNVQLMSKLSFVQPNALLDYMHMYENALPQLKPGAFNWTDPVNIPWNLSKKISYIPPDKNGKADTIYWQRKRHPKAEGYFRVARNVTGSCDLKGGPLQQNHGGVSFVVERQGLDVDAVINYIKSSSILYDGDIAQMHWVCPQEQSIRDAEIAFDVAGANGGAEFRTDRLRHWLSALPWAVVFGDAYVRMFGLDVLLSSPAHCVEVLSDRAVYMQLTPNLADLESNYEAFHAVRQRVQAHLGNDAFFDKRRAYPLRGPMGSGLMSNFLQELQDYRQLPPGSNGFRVPDFRFIDS